MKKQNDEHTPIKAQRRCRPVPMSGKSYFGFLLAFILTLGFMGAPAPSFGGCHTRAYSSTYDGKPVFGLETICPTPNDGGALGSWMLEKMWGNPTGPNAPERDARDPLPKDKFSKNLPSAAREAVVNALRALRKYPDCRHLLTGNVGKQPVLLLMDLASQDRIVYIPGPYKNPIYEYALARVSDLGDGGSGYIYLFDQFFSKPLDMRTGTILHELGHLTDDPNRPGGGYSHNGPGQSWDSTWKDYNVALSAACGLPFFEYD